MSYRSFKRVLGETSLERKCRLLFGACLLLLITGSFWWYGRATEKLVKAGNESTGAQLVDAAMLKYHFRKWETDEQRTDFVNALTEDLENLDYTVQFLALNEDLVDGHSRDIQPPGDRVEQAILRDLKSTYNQWLQDLQRVDTPGEANQLSTAQPPAPDPVTKPAAAESIDPLKRPVLPCGQRYTSTEYHFYQPVYWKSSCYGCHQLTRDLARCPRSKPWLPPRMIARFGS